MSDNYDSINSLVNEVKGNTGFLGRLLFPRIGLLLGVVGVLVIIILIIK